MAGDGTRFTELAGKCKRSCVDRVVAKREQQVSHGLEHSTNNPSIVQLLVFVQFLEDGC